MSEYGFPKYVKLVNKKEWIDTSVLVRHQECYLISSDNELLQENTDGSIFSLGKIEDIRYE